MSTLFDQPLARRQAPLPGTAEGSELCVACGLCCRGVVCDTGVLTADEAELEQRLGLVVLGPSPASADATAFEMPCPCHRDGRCSVYDDRPRGCREYQCKLLRSLLEGKLDLEDCLARVRAVQELAERIAAQIPPGAGKSVWQELKRRLIAGEPVADNERLDAGELLLLLKRDFLLPETND